MLPVPEREAIAQNATTLEMVGGTLHSWLTSPGHPNEALRKELQPWNWYRMPQNEATVQQMTAEDFGLFNGLMQKITELANSGNTLQLSQADILTRCALRAIDKHLPKDVPPLTEHLNRLREEIYVVDNPRGEEFAPKVHAALTVAPETVASLADVFELLPDEGARVNLPVQISLQGGRKVAAMIEVDRKKGISVVFDIPPSERGLNIEGLGRAPETLDRLKKQGYQISFESQPFDDIIKALRAQKYVDNSFWFSQVVADIVAPQDPKTAAVMLHHGVIPPAAVDTNVRQNMLSSLLADGIERKLKDSDRKVNLIIGTDAATGDPTLQYRKKTSGYRVAVRSGEAGEQIVVNSIPTDDKHSTLQESIQDALDTFNRVFGGYAVFMEDNIVQPGIIDLPKTLQERVQVYFKELERNDLTEDVEFMGGYPEATFRRIQNFIDGTLAYADGKSNDKPDSLMLTGPTGVGKSALSRAAAREFAKTKIPIYQISEADAKDPSPHTLIRVLQGFKRTAGGVLILDDIQHFFTGSDAVNEAARKTLLRFLEEINKDRSHILIMNTEDVGKITGVTEALMQTHRVNVIRVGLEHSPQAMQDLLQGALARSLTGDTVVTDSDYKVVTKESADVRGQLDRLCATAREAQLAGIGVIYQSSDQLKTIVNALRKRKKVGDLPADYFDTDTIQQLQHGKLSIESILEQRIPEIEKETTLEAYTQRLVELAGEYQESAQLTPGVVTSALKAANWQSGTMDAVLVELNDILKEKSLTIASVRVDEARREAASLTGQMQALQAQVNELGVQRTFYEGALGDMQVRVDQLGTRLQQLEPLQTEVEDLRGQIGELKNLLQRTQESGPEQIGKPQEALPTQPARGRLGRRTP